MPDRPLPGEPANLPPLREVIARHGLGARKALGQHFLLDLNLTRRIARAAPEIDTGTVVEVGPGPGGLTRALLSEGAHHVIAVEKDRRCLEALRELADLYPERLEVVEGDALTLPLAEIGTAPRQIVSNLPYNISTALLIGWLTALASNPAAFSAFTLMFQKEVAQRLTAEPRSRHYGRLTIITQWLCEVRTLFDIPPRAFTPPPKVTSTVVALRPRKAPLAAAELKSLERVTAAAFGQRRKMLRQSLKPLFARCEETLSDAGIDPTARAEALSVEQFCCLARLLSRSEGEAKNPPGA
ncbi:16S rRNA (adenine(1518)-N(6)/adenine(1519)-N(6))-dimethyltransferase RsmA [Pelagibius sp.]|uniref:16S rRNA (adenine(1518)-N(6)/adenine(1519)-N(6))- dimethyltransferase RsmA n=1 Tax=Pelagibius sp. TaxID=1931238 RepID=UPI002638ED70|nr:16S rRNA (adenine(1518)-N(6)/adenine(1519)-N(6))-dimethyltransferase RsmA [Pelagibius sp.]